VRSPGTGTNRHRPRGALLVLRGIGHLEGGFFFSVSFRGAGTLGRKAISSGGAPVNFEWGHAHRKENVKYGKIPKTDNTKNAWYQKGTVIMTHPVEEGMALDLFLSREGPTPVVFRHLAVGAAPEPEAEAGVFWAREVGGAPGIAERGTTFSTT
jgi:hypothetical protein